MSDAEGLNASAAAVALTLFPVFPQMREKKVGRFDRVTCTVTIGLTPKAPEVTVEQSDAVPPPAEYITVTPATELPTPLSVATAAAV